MLEVRAIDGFYGGSHVLHAVSLDVPEGGRLAVLGRNGAGKSTLLKAIMGAGPRVEGDIAWDGKPLGRLQTFRRARLGLSLVPEDRRIFTHLTALENIAFAAWAAGALGGPEGPVEALGRFPMLGPLRDRLGGRLSGGQQQMLAVARSIAAKPRLLLLDEPTEGLAPVIVESMVADIAAVCGTGKAALLLCEQNLSFARQTTDRVSVIDTGRIVFSGTWPDFDTDARIKERYLAV